MYNRVLFGQALNPNDRLIDGVQKIITEADALLLIPAVT